MNSSLEMVQKLDKCIVSLLTPETKTVTFEEIETFPRPNHENNILN